MGRPNKKNIAEECSVVEVWICRQNVKKNYNTIPKIIMAVDEALLHLPL